MEELKLKLSASEINSKEFQAKNGGYDALELDRYLDLIHERELRAKIMNLKNQTPSTTSLEDALDDLF